MKNLKSFLEGYFIISLSCFGNLLYFNEKVIPKVFWLFKNGQKKCPKLKRAERLW
jgi:hypothetical protein